MGEDDELRDRRALRAAHGLPSVQETQLLALDGKHMKLTIYSVANGEGMEHVYLAVRDHRTDARCTAPLTPLELEVLAFGLTRIAARLEKDEGRR